MEKGREEIPRPEGGRNAPKIGTERHHETRAQALRDMLDDIDPQKLSGEQWFQTDEYARPADISSPYVRGDILREGDYYSPPDRGHNRRSR
jgi:hypothetical protein